MEIGITASLPTKNNSCMRSMPMFLIGYSGNNEIGEAEVGSM